MTTTTTPAPIITVVWAAEGSPKKWIPAEDEYYGGTAEEAKDLSRGLLSAMAAAGLKPVEMVTMPKSRLQAMQDGDTPLERFNADTVEELEMLQLNA